MHVCSSEECLSQGNCQVEDYEGDLVCDVKVTRKNAQNPTAKRTTNRT